MIQLCCTIISMSQNKMFVTIFIFQETLSFIVEVDACVDYSFEVEFIEKNTLWAHVSRQCCALHLQIETYLSASRVSIFFSYFYLLLRLSGQSLKEGLFHGSIVFL